MTTTHMNTGAKVPNIMSHASHTPHTSVQYKYSFIHWHVQNAAIPCCSQEFLPFPCVVYSFLPPNSTS